MLKRSSCILVLLLVVVAVVACGIGPRRFIVPKESFEGSRDRMFDRAVGIGAQGGFTPVYENRRQGILKMSEGAGKKTCFITVQFLRMDDGNFMVRTEYIGYGDLVIDGLNSKIRDEIRNAMMKEAGVSGTESKREASINRTEAKREASSEKNMAKIDMSFKSTKTIESPGALGTPIKIDNYLPPLGQKATYQVQVRWTPAIKKQISWQSILDTMQKRTLNDKQVVPIRRTESTNAKTVSTLDYYVLDETGFYRYAEQKEDMVEPKILDSPNYVFKTPFALNASWEQQSNTVLMRTKIPTTCVVIVDKIDDIVTVPAGSFENCLRIKFSCEVTNSKNQRVNVEAYDWFAPGVGVVKEIRKEKASDPAIGDEGTMTFELSSIQN